MDALKATGNLNLPLTVACGLSSLSSNYLQAFASSKNSLLTELTPAMGFIEIKLRYRISGRIHYLTTLLFQKICGMIAYRCVFFFHNHIFKLVYQFFSHCGQLL